MSKAVIKSQEAFFKRLTKVLQEKNKCIEVKFTKSEIKRDQERRKQFLQEFAKLYELRKQGKLSAQEMQVRDDKLIKDIYSSADAIAFYTKLLELCLQESKHYVEIMKKNSDRNCKVHKDQPECKKVKDIKKLKPTSSPVQYAEFEQIIRRSYGHFDNI